MVKEIEMFNAHQQDVRARADSLAKSVFVLAGGTLTVSIGIFTRESAPQLVSCYAFFLKASWWGLFVSIIFLVITLTIIIARDYMFGERWRKKIHLDASEGVSSPKSVEIVIWVLGVLGLICFLIGMVGQAYVAASVL